MSNATLPAGQSDARFATNAALAETEATTVNLSKEVQSNANQLHNAAFDAATSAQIKEPLSGSAVNQLEEGLAHKTDAAASQGAVDVEAAKATATGYSYVPSTTTTSNAASGVSSTVQSAVATGQQYLASAQEAAKPYVASAIATAKPYVDSAAATAKPYVDQASAAAQPHIEKAKSVLPGVSSTEPAATKPPAPSATTAPLESGPHVVGGPYPATTTGQSTKIAEL
ncbi:hypothetical protein VTO73DRAFT_672 [Trametes versicolor]